MILAFRAAAHMNEDEEDRVETRYRIESAKGERERDSSIDANKLS